MTGSGVSENQETLRVAITQWKAGRDLSLNLEVAQRAISETGRDGAELVLLPENCLFLGTNQEMRAAALTTDGEEISTLRRAAAAACTTVILGGFKRRSSDGEVYNTGLVIDGQGNIVGGYDKIHLFDARIAGQTFQASNVERAGDRPAIAIVNGVKVGLTICYDVRFPELYRQLALSGAQLIIVPSAFTQTTGQAHWEVLLRARAIECGCFIAAPATIRGAPEGDTFPTYGHAMVVDPWGRVLANLEENAPAWTIVPVELAKVDEARNALPVLRGIQPESYARTPIVLSA